MVRMEIALFMVLGMVAFMYFTAERKLSNLHRCFVGTMAFVLFLFYKYIAILVEEETGKPRCLDTVARIFLAASEIGVLLLPIHFTATGGKQSAAWTEKQRIPGTDRDRGKEASEGHGDHHSGQWKRI